MQISSSLENFWARTLQNTDLKGGLQNIITVILIVFFLLRGLLLRIMLLSPFMLFCIVYWGESLICKECTKTPTNMRNFNCFNQTTISSSFCSCSASPPFSTLMPLARSSSSFFFVAASSSRMNFLLKSSTFLSLFIFKKKSVISLFSYAHEKVLRLPEEIFSWHLIEFLINVGLNIKEIRNDDVLECIDSSVGNFDNFIESHETCL